MRFGLLLAGVALMALFACNKPTTTSVTTTTVMSQSAPGSGGYAPLITPGLNISCNATKESVCDDKGCRPQSDGVTPVAFSYEGASGHATFCIGEGCSAAFLTALPAAAPAAHGEDIMGAIVEPGAADSHDPALGPSFSGVAVIKSDGSAFQIIRNGVGVWAGRCEPAPPSHD